MTADEVAKLILEVGLPAAIVIGALAWVALAPEKAQMVSGWIWSLGSGVFRQADRRAVRLRVQGHVNHATKKLIGHLPEGVSRGS